MLVTGAAGDIGAAVCEEFLRQGSPVAATWHESQASLERLRALSTTLGVPFHDRPFDLATAAAAGEAVAWAASVLGRVDCLVPCAGVIQASPCAMTRDDAWERIMAINCTHVFGCCRAAVRLMARSRSGSIVLISSVAGLRGDPLRSAYAASKSALVGFGRSLARELARSGIRVNIVAPGWVESRMTAPWNERQRAAALESVPLGRLAFPSEVAQAVRFLASSRAAYITGAVLAVDGGLGI